MILTDTKGGKFQLLLVLPTEYPFKPPKINFKTRIYHPNVTFDEHGSMCIGILKAEAWKPSSKIMSVLTATQQLLVEPVPDDAVEQSAANKFKEDRKAFDKEAREMTKKYAK
jgi:ubiquitin-protein ligase